MIFFALPLMAGNVFQQLYTVVDTMVVGKALGVDALAALGAADWLNWMMLGLIQGLTQGFAILMAPGIWRKTVREPKRCHRYLHHSFRAQCCGFSAGGTVFGSSCPAVVANAC